MPASLDILLNHLDYTAWASRRIVDAAARLSPEELNHDFKTADHTVLETLVHVFAADRVWLMRLQGQPQHFITDADRSMHVLQTEWPALMQRWKQFASGLTEEQAQARIAYKDFEGNPWERPLWQLVLHVVNHATHHRGQVAGFLRTMGHTPPALDLTAYYREMEERA
jgi:uncharacterized damage-inducible protein DinB